LIAPRPSGDSHKGHRTGSKAGRVKKRKKGVEGKKAKRRGQRNDRRTAVPSQK